MILLVFIVSIMFIKPARNFMNDLIHRDKAELKEEQTIGTVSGYNPRVKEVQGILKESGFFQGVVDGLMGKKTRMAIEGFQKAKGLEPTGKIDSKTWAELSRQEELAKSDSKKEMNSGLSLNWGIPTTAKNENLKMKDSDIKYKTEVQDEIMNYRLKSKDRIRQIQKALKNAGFYKGEADGKMGPQTKKAIKVFQRSKKLNPDGIVGSKTWEELKKYLTTEMTERR